MKLAQASSEKIESFFREHFRDTNLKLPPIYIHFGMWARLITKTFRISGITFGKHVFIAPEFVQRDERGQFVAPFELIVHEATHVLQYQQQGFCGFLLSYLKEWFRFLREQGKRDLDTRWQAYFAISHETAARAAASAYVEWRNKLKM